jgi:hypothetical protein
MELVFIVRDQEVEGSNPFAPTIYLFPLLHLRICNAKFYLLFLLASTAYASYLLIRTNLEIRLLLKDGASVPSLAKRRMFEAGGRLENLHQFSAMLRILFGVFFANESFNTIRAVQFSVLALSPARFDIFGPLIEFAFAAQAILAILYGLQWIGSSRLRSCRVLLGFNEPSFGRSIS